MSNLKYIDKTDIERVNTALDTIGTTLTQVRTVLAAANMPHELADVVAAVRNPDHFRQDAETEVAKWAAAVRLPDYLRGAFTTMAQTAAIPDKTLTAIARASADLGGLPDFTVSDFQLKEDRICVTPKTRTAAIDRATYHFSDEQARDIMQLVEFLKLHSSLFPFIDATKLFADVKAGKPCRADRYTRRAGLTVDAEKVQTLADMYRALADRVNVDRYVSSANTTPGWGFMVEDVVPAYHFELLARHLL